MATIGGFLSGLRDEVTGWGPKIGSRIQQASDALDNAWNSPPPAPAGSNPALRSTDPTPVAPGNDFERGPRRSMRTGAQTADFTVAPDGTAVPKSVGEVVPYDASRIGAQPPQTGGMPPIPPEPEGVAPPRSAAAGAPPIPPEVPPAGAVPPASPEGPKGWWDSAKGRMAAQAGVQSNGLKSAAKIGMSGLEGVGSVAKALGRRAPGVAQAYEIADSASKAFSPEGAAEPMWKHGLRLGARMAGIGGGAALGAIPGAALGPAGVVGGGIAGGALGYEAMNGLSDWALGPEPGQGIADRVKAAGMRAAAKPDMPADVESGSVGKPSANSGAGDKFARTGDPDVDYRNANAYLMAHGARPEQLADSGLRGGVQPAQGENDTAPLRKLAGKGAFGNIAALQGYGALERMKTNSVNAGLRSQQIQATNDLARARMSYEQYKDQRDFGVQQEDKNRGIGDKDIEDYVKSVIPAPATGVLGVGGEKQGQYGDRVGAEVSKLKDQINYTLGNRKDGKRLGQLGGAERQQLLMGAKMKSAIEKARGTPNQWTADFFGNKQADSKDLYSYMPAGVDGSIIPFSGGIRVKTMNGNTMSLKNAAGGGFNFTGPNDPADADVMALLKPHLDAYYKTQGK